MRKYMRGFTAIELFYSLFFIGWVATVVAIICVIVHFVRKFW